MKTLTELVPRAPTPEPGNGVGAPRPLRIGSFSRLWLPRRAVILVVLVALLLLAAGISLATGDYPIPLLRVPEVLLGGGDPLDRFTILQLRAPRTAIGVLVGVALGFAGALTQTVTRNPIASPDILGVSAGAGVGALAVIVLGSNTIVGTVVAVPAAALAGGLVAAVLVYALAWRGGVDGFRLILVGIAVNAVLVALTTWMLAGARIAQATEATVWLTGSLEGRTWEQFWPVTIAVGLFSALSIMVVRSLPALMLGDDSAAALGVHVGASKTVLLIIAVGLTAFSVSAAGPIGFVAFVAPQIALRVMSSAAPPLLASALMGACLVTISDLIARTLLPTPLPVGIVTTAIGGPFLIYLIIRANRRATA